MSVSLDPGSSEETLYQGTYLRLVRRGTWEYVIRSGATGVVVILAVTDQDRLLITEQYRVPVQSKLLELPAGLAGDQSHIAQEDLIVAAQRELLEETGYEASRWTLLNQGPTSAGLSNESISLFRASGLKKVGPGGGDAHENIMVHEVPVSETNDWLVGKRREGLLIDYKIYVGLHFLQRENRTP